MRFRCMLPLTEILKWDMRSKIQHAENLEPWFLFVLWRLMLMGRLTELISMGMVSIMELVQRKSFLYWFLFCICFSIWGFERCWALFHLSCQGCYKKISFQWLYNIELQNCGYQTLLIDQVPYGKPSVLEYVCME